MYSFLKSIDLVLIIHKVAYVCLHFPTLLNKAILESKSKVAVSTGLIPPPSRLGPASGSSWSSSVFSSPSQEKSSFLMLTISLSSSWLSFSNVSLISFLLMKLLLFSIVSIICFKVCFSMKTLLSFPSTNSIISIIKPSCSLSEVDIRLQGRV